MPKKNIAESSTRSMRSSRRARDREMRALLRDPAKVRTLWFMPLGGYHVHCRRHRVVQVHGLWYEATGSDGPPFLVGIDGYTTEVRAIRATLKRIGRELVDMTLEVERLTAIERASQARLKELAAQRDAPKLSQGRRRIRIPRWVDSCDDEMLVSTADDVVGARWRAEVTVGTRAKRLRALWAVAKADMAILDDLTRPRRSRIAAGERAYWTLNRICDRARKENKR